MCWILLIFGAIFFNCSIFRYQISEIFPFFEILFFWTLGCDRLCPRGLSDHLSASVISWPLMDMPLGFGTHCSDVLSILISLGGILTASLGCSFARAVRCVLPVSGFLFLSCFSSLQLGWVHAIHHHLRFVAICFAAVSTSYVFYVITSYGINSSASLPTRIAPLAVPAVQISSDWIVMKCV